MLSSSSVEEPLLSKTIGVALAAYEPPLDYFEAQLRSIRQQEDPNWFCVVTLDSSLRELEEEPRLHPYFEDSRFKWSQNPTRLGVVQNFSRAFGLALEAGADWLAPCDQDDVWYPHKLSVLRRALSACPPESLVHSDMDLLRGDAQDQESGWTQARRDVSRVTPKDLLVWNIATGASMLIDGALVRRYPTIPLGVRYHDHFYALAASLRGGVHPVAERLYSYRQHEGNVIGAQEYRGLFGGRTLKGIWDEGEDARRNYDSLLVLAEAFGVEAPELLEFVRRRDFGAKLFAFGLRSLSHRSLARESLALGYGKLLRSFR